MESAYPGPLHVSQIRKAFIAKFSLGLQKAENHIELQDADEILARCRKKWPKLSAALHKNSYSAVIKGDALVVYLSHSVYLTELQFQKQAIEKKIQTLSGGKIKALVLKYNKGLNFSA